MFKPPQQSLSEDQAYRQEMARRAQQRQQRQNLIAHSTTGKKWQVWVGNQLITWGMRLKGEQQ